MRVIRSHQPVPGDLKGSVLAIGNFDGVHLGHQAVITREAGLARALGAPFATMLFEPHPRQFFQPDKPFFRLTSLDQKLELLSGLGLNLAVVAEFDAGLAGLTAQDFVERLLVGWLAVRHVVVGYDFFFGKGRQGSPQMLQRLGADLGFGVTVVAAAGAAGIKHSSSRIRELLRAGDVAGAAGMLGRSWQIRGEVIGGNKVGTGLGFPTANIALDRGVDLKHGIYAARVHVGGECHDAAAYLGTRPTLDNGRPMLEVFFLNFSGNLYGRTISVDLIDRIRDDRAFDGLDALKSQIAKDVEAARRILAEKRAAESS
jgi:riboflavin kinase/FMN adenylyltransferase